jgi:hypothetical protein
MDSYDTQQVCLNGHQITDSFNRLPEFRKSYCHKCGEKTIHQCPKCNTGIKGYYSSPEFVSLHETPVPSNCEDCGTAYPWEKKKNELSSQVTNKNEYNPIKLIEKVCNRFHLVAKQLRDRHNTRETLDIDDEYDVQDLLHSLLHIFFDDIRPEEWTPSYAGKSARMDFLLKNDHIVIEVKKTRKNLNAKEVGSELIEDIARYKEQPDCKTLICFVYDPEGRIANPRGIENDLSQNNDELVVKVLIEPKRY